MIPTMNLQLLTTLTMAGASESNVAAPQTPEIQPILAEFGFAEWLGFQAGPAPVTEEPRGEFLPPGGNELPVPTPVPADALREPLIDLPLLAEGELDAAGSAFAFAAQWPGEPPARQVTEAGPDPIGSTRPPGLNTLPPDRPSVNAQPLSLPRGPAAPSPQLAGKAPEVMPADRQSALAEAREAIRPITTPASTVMSASANQPPPLPVDRAVIQPGETVRVPEPMMSTASGDGSRTNLLADGQVVPRALPVVDISPQSDRPAVPLPTAQSPAAPLPAPASPSPAAMANTASPGMAGSIPDVTTGLIRTPVGETGWGDQLGERVLLLAGNRKHQAEIRLTPADLGPVRIRIAMEDGAAHVTFHAQHATTREAIEAAMPRLRDMLADSGLALGQTSVGGDSVAEGQRERSDAPQAAQLTETTTDEADEPQVAERRYSVASNSLVDTFA